MNFSFVPPEDWVLAIADVSPMVLLSMLTIASLTIWVTERAMKP